MGTVRAAKLQELLRRLSGGIGKRMLSLADALCCFCVQVFLWPIGAMLLLLPFAVLSGFNPSIFTLSVYFG